MPLRPGTPDADKPASVAFRFSIDDHTYTVGITLPAWVYIWVVTTIANAFGLTEPIKAAVGHLMGWR